MLAAAISLAICTLLILCAVAGADEGLKRKRVRHVSLQLIVAFFLVVWWAAAAGVLTVQGPFDEVGNAYFSLWTGLVCAVGWFGKVSGQQAASRSMGSLLGLLTCSVVLLLATWKLPSSLTKPTVAWSVALGISSSLIALLLFFGLDRLRSPTRKFLAMLLVVLWAPGAGVLTFKEPFTTACGPANPNGYFAAWLGLFCAIAFVTEQV
eukprot:CAMPEP_0119312178 /NCGR_PEP_ID=MMETSP1333-20130426/25389_1 /TAXON_ID=418940 /ORGANISM="Scyphosphaera apsteinii, Strain RCC1455" /LENGTH=207 /DNA_ID=CAMNT_0007316759 /DNA_START=242 /DNA_END=865 /DNA_ORIENTATION=-